MTTLKGALMIAKPPASKYKQPESTKNLILWGKIIRIEQGNVVGETNSWGKPKVESL